MPHRLPASPSILVLGKFGQVGYELRRTLAPLGTVTALDVQDLDLLDVEATRNALRALRPQVVVNATAYTAVDRAEDDPETARRLNAVVPAVLAEEAKGLGALLVHYSTDYVYDGDKDGRWVETDPTGPLSVYGRTKLEGDEAIAAAGCDHLIFRISWVYGARGGNFLLTMLRLARERKQLSIVDDQIGAPTWSRLIAESTALALARWEGQRGVYHLAPQGETSWCGFAKALLALDPKKEEQIVEEIRPLTTAEYPTKARRPRNSRLDASRLAADFGIRLPAWDESLRQVME